MANIAEMQEQGKALDLDTGKWVTAGEFTNEPNGGLDPIPTKETPEEPVKPETEAKKDDSQAAKSDDNNPPAKSTDKPDEVVDGQEPKKEEPKKEEPPKTDNKPAEEVKFEPGSYIKEKFSERFGLESEKDLEEVLSQTNEVIEMYKNLQKENEELKKAGPQFRNEQEKKIFEFLKPFDPNRFGEGLNTAASLMGMDPAAASDDQVLMESYILKHPDLTREEAKLLFEDEYGKRYSINKDDFDNESDYNKRKAILDIQRKNEVAQGRKELTARKQELMAPKEEPKKDNAQKDQGNAPQAAAAVDPKVMAPYLKELESFMRPAPNKVFDRINYLNDDGKTLRFSLLLDPERREFIEANIKKYLERPDIYDKNGKIIDNFDPGSLARTFLRVGYGDWMDEQLLNAAETIAKGMTAEQIANRKPDKSSGSGGDAKLGVDDQWAEQARKAKEQRDNAKRR